MSARLSGPKRARPQARTEAWPRPRLPPSPRSRRWPGARWSRYRRSSAPRAAAVGLAVSRTVTHLGAQWAPGEAGLLPQGEQTPVVSGRGRAASCSSPALVLLTAHAEVDRTSWCRSDEDRRAIMIERPARALFSERRSSAGRAQAESSHNASSLSRARCVLDWGRSASARLLISSAIILTRSDVRCW